MANQRICSVEVCGKPAKAKGYCTAHYKRMRRWGDPLLYAPVKEKKTCSVIDCGLPVNARGLCNKHYPRLKRYGDPAKPVNEHRSKAAWEFLDSAMLCHGSGCLIWPFSTNGSGYATIMFDGEHVLVHRISCVIRHGPSPAGKPLSLHECGNGTIGCMAPCCVYWGDDQDNSEDKIRHGFSNRGERHPLAVLTEADVLEIRRLEGLTSRKQIAIRFGISPDHVKHIHYRHTWKWLK